MENPTAQHDWPGQRRGLPESGPGSVAGWGVRIAAITIDWLLSLLATSAIIGRPVWDSPGSMQWAPLGVFALEASLLTALLGGSAGQLVTRITVRRTSGAPLDLSRAVVRSLLICAVIPPLVFNQDNQGLHDLAVDSIALNR